MSTENKSNIYAIVGMRHRDAVQFVNDLPPDEPLTLIREPTNRFDSNAIQVWAHDRHVGYISKDQNAVLAKFIDGNGNPWVVRASPPQTAVADSATITVKSIVAKLHRGPNGPMVEV